MHPPTRQSALSYQGPVFVAESEIHGRGVFAAEPIATGAVIEICPVLRLPAAEREIIDGTLLFEYYFEWDDTAAIALGFGSLYNHGSQPNAEYQKDTALDLVTVRAIVPIAAGDEITFSYSGPATV